MTVNAATAETVYPLVGANLGPFNSGWLAEDLTQIAVWLDTGAGAVQIAGGLVVIGGVSPLTTGINVTLSAGNLVAGAWPAGSQLTLQRVTPKTQPSALGEAVGFDPATYEAALDHIDRQVQDLAVADTHAIRAEPGDYPAVLPPAESRAGKWLVFDGLGNPQVATTPGTTPGYVAVRVIIGSDGINASDDFLSVQVPFALATITLPDPATCAGRRLIIKDALGRSGAWPITVQPAVGLIDRQALYVINTPLASITVISDGSQWSII